MVLPATNRTVAMLAKERNIPPLGAQFLVLRRGTTSDSSGDDDASGDDAGRGVGVVSDSSGDDDERGVGTGGKPVVGSTGSIGLDGILD